MLKSSIVKGQNSEPDLTNLIEFLFPIQDEAINYEDLYENLIAYQLRPLNLNTASREELSSLYILNNNQIESLLKHRENNGFFLSIYEIQAVPEIDVITIRLLLPFITVTESVTDNRSLFSRIINEPNNYFMTRYTQALQKADGYRSEGNYIGHRSHIYSRFSISHKNDFSFGITAEKDPGENMKQLNGFDYYSTHFLIEKQGILRKLVIGDYRMQFGQGLVFGGGFNPGKGAETVNTVRRSNIGLKPYTSVQESGYFRGIGTTLGKGKFKTTIFLSRLKQDGNIQDDTTYSDYDEYVNSIQQTGYHRTINEINGRNKISEISYGGAIYLKPVRNLQIGMSNLGTQFDKPLQKKTNNYNQYEFSGYNNLVGSLFYSLNYQNFVFFGESAISKSGGKGHITGFTSSLFKNIDLSLSYRNYAKNFHSFYANSFGENSRSINESGFYWGLKIKPSQKHLVACYFDKFYFPWLKYRTESPSHGYEYLARYSYFHSRNINLYFQVREELKQISKLSNDGILNELVNGRKRNFWINLDYNPVKHITFRSKVMFSEYRIASATSNGFVLVEDITFKYNKYKFSTLFSLFDSDDFENRQYVNERDALYAFSVPAYQGQGLRYYLMVQYTLSGKITFWMKYGRFYYKNVDYIGSGNDQIEGNVKSSIRIQSRIRF